jgi:ribosomal protein L21E
MIEFVRRFSVGDLIKIRNEEDMLVPKKYRGSYGKVIEYYGRVSYLVEIQTKILFWNCKKIITVDDIELSDAAGSVKW